MVSNNKRMIWDRSGVPFHHFFAEILDFMFLNSATAVLIDPPNEVVYFTLAYGLVLVPENISQQLPCFLMVEFTIAIAIILGIDFIDVGFELFVIFCLLTFSFGSLPFFIRATTHQYLLMILFCIELKYFSH